MNSLSRPPILLAITGASGSIYALKFLEIMRQLGQPVHSVISGAGQKVIEIELGPEGLGKVSSLCDLVYSNEDLTSAPASGSSIWHAMVVLPCTMGTLSAVANGISQNLIHRAADVFLKEKRPLLLVLRETPLNQIHLENMLKASRAGAVIYPAMPSFYHQPRNIDQMAYFFAGRIAEFLGFHVEALRRWGEEKT